MMIYTSRYFNPELRQNLGKYLSLQISVGAPRFLTHIIGGAIEELKPYGLLDIHDKYEYREQYIERLNSVGSEQIRRILDNWQQSTDKDIVLCCYEDVRKMGNNWCHRTMFANWFFEQTGIKIDELPDPTKFKREYSDTPFTDIFEGFF